MYLEGGIREGESERERASSSHQYIPQMAVTSRSGLGQNQEPQDSSRSSPWVASAQILGPSSAFPSVLARSQIRSGVAGTKTGLGCLHLRLNPLRHNSGCNLMLYNSLVYIGYTPSVNLLLIQWEKKNFVAIIMIIIN